MIVGRPAMTDIGALRRRAANEYQLFNETASFLHQIRIASSDLDFGLQRNCPQERPWFKDQILLWLGQRAFEIVVKYRKYAGKLAVYYPTVILIQ